MSFDNDPSVLLNYITNQKSYGMMVINNCGHWVGATPKVYINSLSPTWLYLKNPADNSYNQNVLNNVENFSGLLFIFSKK